MARWRFDHISHAALPLVVARDEHDGVVFAGFDNETGAGLSSLERFAAKHGAELDPDDGTGPARDQLIEYLDGRRRTFDLRLTLLGTEFQRAAWNALLAIPYGETRTYGAQAQAIGRPTAVRAIGHANGDNPIPLIVPCHRVIGANGSLTGFGGGVDVKRWLLALERTPDHPPAWTPEGDSARHTTEQLGLL